MMQGALRRLEKLETAMLPPGGGAAIKLLTRDELEIRILDLSRRMVADPAASSVERDAASRHTQEIEAGIRYMASLRHRPSYAAHLDRMASDHPGYVPAVCASLSNDGLPNGSGFEEYGDLDKPRIMTRRAALRARTDIAALINEGAST